MRLVVTRLDELNNDDGWVDEKEPRALDEGERVSFTFPPLPLLPKPFKTNVAGTTLLPMNMVLFSLDVVANAKERNNKEALRDTGMNEKKVDPQMKKP
jgi:hypothetical protein